MHCVLCLAPDKRNTSLFIDTGQTPPAPPKRLVKKVSGYTCELSICSCYVILVSYVSEAESPILYSFFIILQMSCV